jgi:hypothetical protein
VGQPQALSTGNVIPAGGHFLADSKRLLFEGHEAGHAPRVYVANLDGGQPRPITPEGYGLGSYPHTISPTSDGIALVSAAGSDPQPVRGSQPVRRRSVGRRMGTRCSSDDAEKRRVRFRVWTLDWRQDASKTVAPADVAGGVGYRAPVSPPTRSTTFLFLVEHLK